MEKRINIQQIEPKAFGAMFALESYVRTSGLSNTHRELLKIRSSQLNGCAYCIDMHTAEAIKAGETARRIFALSAWRESHLFNDEERIVLTMTDEITLISKAGLTTETYERAIAAFGENYTAQLIVAIAAINTWNRIALATHLVLEP